MQAQDILLLAGNAVMVQISESDSGDAYGVRSCKEARLSESRGEWVVNDAKLLSALSNCGPTVISKLGLMTSIRLRTSSVEGLLNPLQRFEAIHSYCLFQDDERHTDAKRQPALTGTKMLRKPFRPEELVSAVRAVLAQR